MDLADQIEAFRQQMVDDHDRLMDQVSELDHALLENDVELMKALQAAADGQAYRAGDILQVMERIRAGIRYAVTGPQHGNGYPQHPGIDGHHQQMGLQSPQDAPGAASMAQRFSPPLREEATTGDDLGLYGHQTIGAQH